MSSYIYISIYINKYENKYVMQKVNRGGPNIDPCGTPLLTIRGLDLNKI